MLQNSARSMKIRSMLVLIAICLWLSGCASLKNPDGTVDTGKLVSRAETAINTLTWTKSVCDTVFDVGCACGKFPPSTCEVYQLSSRGAQLGIDTARNALDNYRESGSALNEELLLSALKEMTPLLLKFDLIYKQPDTVASTQGEEQPS